MTDLARLAPGASLYETGAGVRPGWRLAADEGRPAADARLPCGHVAALRAAALAADGRAHAACPACGAAHDLRLVGWGTAAPDADATLAVLADLAARQEALAARLDGAAADLAAALRQREELRAAAARFLGAVLDAAGAAARDVLLPAATAAAAGLLADELRALGRARR